MQRFRYHFEPNHGWMNDPNGLIQFQGTYHAFFQHNPHDTKWGPMHWGHATSGDLIHWDEQPVALFPDCSYENDGGCFSGSAIESEGKLWIFYTSVSKDLGQTQSAAYSEDGIHFTKYEGNPIIPTFPAADATGDFRDPKVFRYGDEYRMLIGTRYNGKGRVLQYRSEDLLHWDYIGILYESIEYHDVIECPDLFCVNGTWVLMYSKIGTLGYQTQFILGDYDGIRFLPHSYQSPEVGPQFYAPQSFENDIGERIVIGWFYDWNRSADVDAESAGAFAIPRIVSIAEDGVLKLFPVQSASALLRSIDPAQCDLSIEQSRISGISIRVSPDQVRIQSTSGQPYIHRGIIRSVALLEDEKAAELFINEGEANFSLWRDPLTSDSDRK